MDGEGGNGLLLDDLLDISLSQIGAPGDLSNNLLVIIGDIQQLRQSASKLPPCLLYTSDAADE